MYAAAAARKADSLGRAHPDYAETLFHMAEAKRAGGDGASAATLLEESVRVLDAVGLGGTGPALRRLERLAQVQGDVLGDHAAAEVTRRRVLEAREQAAAEAAGGPKKNADVDADTGTNGESGGGSGKVRKGGGKMGLLKAAAMASHGGAIAAASEAHAASLAELGRWDDARAAMRRSIDIHEVRVRGPGGGGFLEDALESFKGVVKAALNGGLQAVFSGGGGPGPAADAAALSLALQLAAARVKYAEFEARAARCTLEQHQSGSARAALGTIRGVTSEGGEGGAGRGEGSGAGGGEGGGEEQLKLALAVLQPMAEGAAAGIAHEAATAAAAAAAAEEKDEHYGTEDRTVAADMRRREAVAAPERHVTSLLLFARTARGLAALEAVSQGAASSAAAGPPPAPSDALAHVGDAVEWLHAGSRAAAAAAASAAAGPRPAIGGVVAEAGRRALTRELRECRLFLQQ